MSVSRIIRGSLTTQQSIAIDLRCASLQIRERDTGIRFDPALEALTKLTQPHEW